MKTVLTLLLSISAVVAVAQGPASPAPPGTASTGARPSQSSSPAPPNPSAVVAVDATPGALRGRILTTSGRPARRASVRLLYAQEPVPGHVTPAATVSADLEGRYEFKNVRPNDYRVSAGKPGYLPLEYGQLRSFEPGTTITLAAGAIREAIDVTLPASGAISGRVVDDNGDPVVVLVRLMQFQFAGNRRQLIPVPGVATRVTDDEGAYRVFGIPPGQYVVLALLAEPSRVQTATTLLPPGYVSTYCPGTVDPSNARVLTLGLSQDLPGIDITLARVATARVSGTLTDSQGRPIQTTAPNGSGVSLIASQRSGALLAEPLIAANAADGSFQFGNVPPGDWVLQVVGPGRTQQREAEFAAQFVTVNGADVSDLRVQTSAGSRVEGRVVFEGNGAPDISNLAITTVAANADLVPRGATLSGPVRTDGTFALDGLSGPRFIRLAQTAPSLTARSWSLKAVRLNGRDVTDTPLMFGRTQDSITDAEVVLTNLAARISGRATDAGGQQVSDYTVIVFSTDAERWQQGLRFKRFSRSAADGSFTVADLPAGEYHVAAVDRMKGDDAAGEWQDPEFLQSIASRATRVTAIEGQQLSLTPRLIVR